MIFWTMILLVSFAYILLAAGEWNSHRSTVALLGISATTAMVHALQRHWVLHRVQMVIVTLSFGAIFLWNAATLLTMPEFSATMLALMGISSATYVGFKFV
jgi:hypothetical protein